jgi:amino acid transporter
MVSYDHEFSVSSDEKGWPFWRLKLISVIMLGILTGFHIYSSRLAVTISQIFAIIKLSILTIISIAGLLVLKEGSDNWSNSIEDTDGFGVSSFAFVLVCNLI